MSHTQIDTDISTGEKVNATGDVFLLALAVELYQYFFFLNLGQTCLILQFTHIFWES